MARRRLLKSYFYVEYDGQKYLNGGTVTIPPFEATGGTDSFTIHSSRAWEINNKPAWLTLSKDEGKRGSTSVSLIAATNPGSAQRTGELNVGLKCFLSTKNIDVALSQKAAGTASIVINFINATVGATATTNTFTLACTEIDLSTLGYYAVESDGIVSCNLANSSVTIAANDTYQDRTIRLAITGTSTVGNPVTGTAQFTQSKKIVTPSLTITYTGTGEPATSGNTNAFSLSKNYITEITRYAVTPSAATITASGQTGLTVQYPENQTDGVKQYTVSVSGTDVYGALKTGSTSFAQSADTYEFRLNPTAHTASSIDVQYSFAIVSNNVSNIGVSQYSGVLTGASITGSNLVVKFAQNQTSDEKSGTVTITGKTVGGRTVSASGNLVQTAAESKVLSIEYTGSTLSPESGSTNKFTIIAQNVTVTGYTTNSGASVSNTGTSTVTLNYPTNQNENTSAIYTVTVWGKDDFNNTLSASCQVTQSADTYSFTVTPSAQTIEWNATETKFTTTQTNVTNVGYYAPDSQNINSCSKNGDIYTAAVSENSTSSQKTIKFVASGNTRGGRVVYASGTTMQEAKPAAGNLIVTPDGTQIGSGATSVTFTVAWTGLSAGSQITMAVSSAITSTPSSINVGNNTTSSVTISVNVSANPDTSSRNATLSASGIDNLSSARTDAGYYTQNGKQMTYTLTFVMPQTGDTLLCGFNGGSQEVVATNTTSHTITGLVAGDVVAYTMTKAGYVSATSSITMGNSDETLNLTLFTNDFHFAVTPGISPDLNNNLFKVTFLADNLFIGDAVLTGNSENSGLGQYHFTLPNNYVMNGFDQNSGDFTYQIEYLTGGINIVSAYVAAIEVGQSTTASSLSEANAFMGNMGILKAKFIRLAYYGTYPSGNFSVTPDAGSIDSGTTGAVFTITYQNLAAPSIITVQAGTNVTGLSETQIQVSTTGQATTTVTAYCTTNQSQSQRAIQIEASGTSMVGPILHDGGTYYQKAAEPIPAGSIEWNSSAITVPAFSGNDGTSSFMHDLHFTQSNIDVNTIGVYITSGSSFISLDDLRESYGVATFEIQPNGEDRDRRTGIVWVSGTGLDNLTYSSRCEVTQESGVTPYIAILSGSVWQHGGYTINLPASGEFNYTEFDLDWGYLNPDSIGVSASGGNITDWQEVPSTNMHEIEIRLTANTTTSQTQSYITFTGTSVYGDPVSATLRIFQEGQAIPTTTFYWDYSIHFAGTHGSRVNTEFRIMSGSQIVCSTTIDLEDLSTTTVDDVFSGTTQITIPTSLYNNINVDYYTYDTSNHRYIGANLNTEKRNGRLVTTLDVPSLELIQLQLIVQAFNDSRAPFFFAFSAQSVDHVDQMPVQGYDTGVTQLRIITGLVPSAGTVSESANTSQYTGASIYPYYTRMGYELEIVVDTASTSAFTTLKAVVEDSRHNLDELTVVGSSNKYRVYLGGTGENFNGGTIFLKFINTDVPQTPTLTITPNTKTVNADATATTFTVTWSNIPGGSVNLTASSVSGSPSFSPNSTQTATTLAGASGSRQITLYFDKVSPGGSERTYDVTATAGGLSDSIKITQTGSAMLMYHTSPLTLEGNAGNTYYVESVTIKTYDGVRNNEISWAVNHTVDSNGYTAPYSSCTISYNGMTSSTTRISLVMTEITVLLNGNGDRPNTVQLTIKGMTGQSGSRPTNSYFLQADSQNRYKFIIPTNLPSESVGDVLLGKIDDFPASPKINISIN